jgi:hypothetical protein
MLAGHLVYGTALALLVGRRAGTDGEDRS